MNCIVDDFANLRICGPEQRCVRRHSHLFSGIADFEGDVERQPVANVHYEWRAGVPLEAGKFHRCDIRTCLQTAEQKLPVRLADGLDRDARLSDWSR